MQSSIFRKWHVPRCVTQFCPRVPHLRDDRIVIIRVWTWSHLLFGLQEFPIVPWKCKLTWIVKHGMNHCFLAFQVAANTWALFQIKGLLHAGVANLFVGGMIVVEARFSLWQPAAFVSNRIFDVIVVSIGSRTHSLQFLFILCEIVLLAIANADLLGSAPLATWKLIMVLNGHLLIYFLKGAWDVEPFVLSYAVLVVCKRTIVFLICIFCTRR